MPPHNVNIYAREFETGVFLCACVSGGLLGRRDCNLFVVTFRQTCDYFLCLIVNVNLCNMCLHGSHREQTQTWLGHTHREINYCGLYVTKSWDWMAWSPLCCRHKSV